MAAPYHPRAEWARGPGPGWRSARHRNVTMPDALDPAVIFADACTTTWWSSAPGRPGRRARPRRGTSTRRSQWSSGSPTSVARGRIPGRSPPRRCARPRCSSRTSASAGCTGWRCASRRGPGSASCCSASARSRTRSRCGWRRTSARTARTCTRARVGYWTRTPCWYGGPAERTASPRTSSWWRRAARRSTHRSSTSRAPGIYDSDSILLMSEVPHSLVVLGGGVVGCEYACTFAALGIPVTLVEARSPLLSFLDLEMSTRLKGRMEGLGVQFRMPATVEAVEVEEGRVTVGLQGGRHHRRGGAAGRLGPERQHRGHRAGGGGREGRRPRPGAGQRALPDPRLATSTRPGTCVGFPALASTVDGAGPGGGGARLRALPEGRARADPSLRAVHHPRAVDGRRDRGVAARRRASTTWSGRAAYATNARGQIIGDGGGFLKLIFRREDMKLLGVHVIGEPASELVHIGLDRAALHGRTAQLFIETCYNYPTLSETYKYATYNALAQREPAVEPAAARRRYGRRAPAMTSHPSALGCSVPDRHRRGSDERPGRRRDPPHLPVAARGGGDPGGGQRHQRRGPRPWLAERRLDLPPRARLVQWTRAGRLLVASSVPGGLVGAWLVPVAGDALFRVLVPVAHPRIDGALHRPGAAPALAGAPERRARGAGSSAK